MLDTLTIDSFTVFDDIEFQFSTGLNVIIGDNGTGKSHLLKLAYSVAALAYSAHQAERPPTKAELQKEMARKLKDVFRPDSLGRLVRSHRARGVRGGRARAQVTLRFHAPADSWSFNFSNVAQVEVAMDDAPKVFPPTEPIFIPTKEVISMFPGFAALYRNREVAMDETYFDLCLALDPPPLRGPRLDAIKQLLDPIEAILGGSVTREGDNFYLDSANGKTEMPLVAEGVRKIATIAHLLRNGALNRRGMVFWDEPESNLNPRLIREVAKMLVSLASQGVQIFVGTHSFFLMKELDMLRRHSFPDLPCRYITLSADNDGLPVFEQANSLKEVTRIVALDEELAQYDRELQGDSQ